ncbi:MAG: sulfotransferase domain-containing protein [Streptosporangiaceae bacterium]
MSTAEARSRERPVRVIYLGGLGRSGSTLLERLLGELPGVCASGEIVHLWQRGVAENERCGCGLEFSACDFWKQVGKEAFGGWEKVDTGRIGHLKDAVDRTRMIPRLWHRSLLSPRMRSDLAEYSGYYLRLYRAITDVSGCEAVVDSSKHASLAFCLNSRQEIDLRVIHVVRDSRAVAYSWTTKVARPEASAPGRVSASGYMTTYSPAKAAGQWNAQNGALQLLARRGTPVLRVRYEDLVQATEQTLRRSATFAGVPAGDVSLPFLHAEGDERYTELTTAHTASGNPMRFTTGRLAIRGDERWRAAMPARHRRTVTALTLPLLSQYGYLGRAA